LSNIEMNNGEAASKSPKALATAAADTVKQEVSTFAASTQEKMIERVGEKKETAAQTLTQFASAIRTAGDELAQNDQSVAGRVVRQAADGLESFTRSMANKRPEEIFDAVRDFGRRNPGAFIAGAVLAGLAAGRFLRSSASPQTGQGENLFSDRGQSARAWVDESAAAPEIYPSDVTTNLEAEAAGEPWPSAGSPGGAVRTEPEVQP
jgi:hypothetical protein